MAKKDDIRDAMTDPSSGLTPDANDADDVRTYEHPDAQRVRDGEMSAAQLEGGGANINPDYPDAQYPPGIVDNSSTALAAENVDVYETLPERTSNASPSADIDI
jgi:hypothetical protein